MADHPLQEASQSQERDEELQDNPEKIEATEEMVKFSVLTNLI